MGAANRPIAGTLASSLADDSQENKFNGFRPRRRPNHECRGHCSHDIMFASRAAEQNAVVGQALGCLDCRIFTQCVRVWITSCGMNRPITNCKSSARGPSRRKLPRCFVTRNGYQWVSHVTAPEWAGSLRLSSWLAGSSQDRLQFKSVHGLIQGTARTEALCNDC